MDFRRLLQSFKDAINGVKYVFSNEQNFRIQVYLAIFVLILISILGLRNSEIIIIILMIAIVLILELLNSALEKFADLLKPRLSVQIQIIKDILAAMVFLSSIVAIIIGSIILWPYFFRILVGMVL